MKKNVLTASSRKLWGNYLVGNCQKPIADEQYNSGLRARGTKCVESLWSGRVSALRIRIRNFGGPAKKFLATEQHQKSPVRNPPIYYLTSWKWCCDVEVPLGKVGDVRWLGCRIHLSFWSGDNFCVIVDCCEMRTKGISGGVLVGCQEKTAYLWLLWSIRKPYTDTLFRLS